ncbi:MAG: hypothetical protein MN733_16675 [Nitrososphaera sp.]|nr:hypothetical protein [Nitrososphaera sp.]
MKVRRLDKNADSRWTRPFQCKRVGPNTRNDKWVQFASLGQTAKIESLRWRSLLRLHKLFDRWTEIVKSAAPIGGFIVDSDTNEPRRYRCYHSDYGWTCSEDDDFKKKTNNHLVELAKVGALSPEAIAIGKLYENLEKLIETTRLRLDLFNILLEESIRHINILPIAKAWDNRRVTVMINDRGYLFKLGYQPMGCVDDWPSPDSPIIHIKPFIFEESIGLRKETILARFGNPTAKFTTRSYKKNFIEDGNVWVFGDKALRFDDSSTVDYILSPEELKNLNSVSTSHRLKSI